MLFVNHRSVYKEVVDVDQSFFSKGLFLGVTHLSQGETPIDGFSR